MADLAELLERVKAATGPSIDLNADLLRAFGWQAVGSRVLDPDGRHCLQVPNLTASLDAALALVERVLPGRPINLTRLLSGEWMAHVTEFDDSAFAPTPALAILGALLTSLSEAEPEVGSSYPNSQRDA